MAQQKGFKRAIKVANRKRKLAVRKKEATLKRVARQDIIDSKEAEAASTSS